MCSKTRWYAVEVPECEQGVDQSRGLGKGRNEGSKESGLQGGETEGVPATRVPW